MDSPCTHLVENGRDIFILVAMHSDSHRVQCLQELGSTRVLVQFKPNRPKINCHGNTIIGAVTTQRGVLSLTKALGKVAEQVIYYG